VLAGHGGSGFSFVQISDSHIGFNKAANQDVTGTLKLALDKINALPGEPDLLLHTGDITHSSKPAEFDTAQQMHQGRQSRRDVLCSRRARYCNGRRRDVSGPVWQGDEGQGVVQLHA
jgi:3',5'-cyclic AMP phosphodiesterase CpdA